MTEFEPEFQPSTEVDPADGIYEGDAVEVLEDEQPDPAEEYLDAERHEEPDTPEELDSL